MTFLAPIWLTLLFPWAVACWRAGRGMGRAARVPFLALWPAAMATQTARRKRPPLWLVLLLAAALSAVLAAAGPAWRGTATTLTVVVDRGPSMTPARLRAAAARLPIGPATRVHVVPVPGEAYDAVGGIDAGRLEPTAALEPAVTEGNATDPDRNALAMIRAAARRAGGAVIVLSDRTTDLPAGAVRVGPGLPLVNAGIDRFAVVPGPRPQAMIRVFNGTDRRRAMLRVDGVGRAIDLPATGQAADYFLDLPAVGDTTTATLLAEDGRPWADDVAGDDRAYLARVATPGRIEPRTPLSEPLGRMAAVYGRRRPAGADAKAIAIVRGGPPATAAVVLARSLGVGAGEVSVDAGHPVSRSAGGLKLSGVGLATGGPAGDGWRVLVRAGDSALLAVRESPARQVWVGFDSDASADRTAYVVFWTDVFDWLGGGPAEWATGPTTETPSAALAIVVADAGLNASPGLYRNDNGRPFATDMAAVRSGELDTPAGTATAPLAARSTVARPLTSWILVVALGLILTALLKGAWLDRNLTDP